MAFRPLSGERNLVAEVLRHPQAQTFYQLEEAAERVLSTGRTNGHYAISPWENDILQRYVEILDLVGMSAEWDYHAQRYRVYNIATASSIGALLGDYARSEARGVPLTPSASLLGNICRRTSQQDRVRLIPTQVFFGLEILIHIGPYINAQSG